MPDIAEAWIFHFYEGITKKEPLEIKRPPYLFGSMDSTKLCLQPESKQEKVS